MRIRIHVVLPVLVAIAAPLSAAAQQPRLDPAVDETTAIMIAAARLIRLELPSDSVLVDVDDGATGAAARGRAVAAALHARAGKVTFRCSRTRMPSTCHLVGAVGGIVIVAPRMRGDTAAVQVRVLKETTSVRQPIFRADYLVKLVQADGRWVVVSSRVTSIT